MNDFNRLLRIHQKLAKDFRRTKNVLKKKLGELQQFNRKAAEQVEESRNTLSNMNTPNESGFLSAPNNDGSENTSSSPG